MATVNRCGEVFALGQLDYLQVLLSGVRGVGNESSSSLNEQTTGWTGNAGERAGSGGQTNEWTGDGSREALLRRSRNVSVCERRRLGGLNHEGLNEAERQGQAKSVEREGEKSCTRKRQKGEGEGFHLLHTENGEEGLGGTLNGTKTFLPRRAKG